MSETRQAENFPDLAVVPALLLPRLRRPARAGRRRDGSGRRARRTYVDWWLAVCGLIVLLLIVAAWDMTTKPGL